MTRRELIRETSFRSGYTQKVCDEILREIFDILSDEMESHGNIVIPNFGMFDVYDKKATTVRHPETGELIEVKQKKYPRFTPAEALKHRVCT